MAKVVSKGRKSARKNVVSGIAHIHSSFNNTMITITDMKGDTIAFSSAGLKGFSGSKKSTPYAAQMAGEDAAKKAQVHGLKNIEVYIKGLGSGREAAVRALHSSGLEVKLIRECTPVAHGGCKPPKQRRI
ncbi:MAG: 30S ribosomal protein S11 [Alphaproteobacteria bacterium 40-19]|nr:MAG: 30S ribosomal protein S11 [Alphaproteobacteria bacterium 40-19]